MSLFGISSGVSKTIGKSVVSTPSAQGFWVVRFFPDLKYYTIDGGGFDTLNSSVATSADLNRVRHDKANSRIFMMDVFNNKIYTADEDGTNVVTVLDSDDITSFSSKNDMRVDTPNGVLVLTSSEGVLTFDLATLTTKTIIVSNATLPNQSAVAIDTKNSRYYMLSFFNDTAYVDFDGANLNVDVGNLVASTSIQVDHQNDQIFTVSDTDTVRAANYPEGASRITWVDLGVSDLTDLELDRANNLLFAINTGGSGASEGIFQLNTLESYPDPSTHDQVAEYQFETGSGTICGFAADIV